MNNVKKDCLKTSKQCKKILSKSVKNFISMQHTNLKFKMQSTMYDSVQHVENFNLCTNVREYILGLD